jgi:molecular chaperone DnaK
MHPASAPRIQKTVGIDLGTTNSVISMLDLNGQVLITGHDEQARMTFPSLVGHDAASGRLVAGRDALALVHDPASATLPLASVKRFMGLERRFALGPQSLSAPEVSALILRGLRDWLSRSLAEPRFVCDRAIITMPAYFNHNQIEATRHAGELAGYDVVELLHEPTAAAIYYSWVENHGDATYLVYDLGGGTFDVSVIRRRLDDYEVLAVSGDPFLGGDDFDRLLATHLIETGTWKWGDDPAEPHVLFDPTTEQGAVPFARLARIAEAIKSELTTAQSVERFVPQVLCDEQGRTLSLEATVSRAAFQRLIREKIDRTIDCCHEALGRAKERAGVRLGDVDHIVLVGGSSRVPLVREVVQAAFANPALAEHVRSPQPLLHEPDLCVAYGAALRAAGHGTRYLFSNGVSLQLSSPATTREATYHAAGVARAADEPTMDGYSVRIRPLASGLLDEAFVSPEGGFDQALELERETDNVIEWTVCDAGGQERARVVTTVRHQEATRPLGQGVLPTQLITKPLSIEVLTRGRQRVKQVIAPIGATLPGQFRCTCRTSDSSGQIVLPIFEENRVIKRLVIEEIDTSLPVGSPVEVEFTIDARHTIEVSVRVKAAQGRAERLETATIEPPPAPRRPTRAEIDEVQAQLEQLLEQLTGRYRTRARARAQQLRQDLLEAMSYDDEPRAIQRMAELRELVQQAELARSQTLEPPWPQFTQLVRHCLDVAADVANRTGRDRDDLFQHVHAQERYAEQAHEEHNQTLYRECWDNLQKYAGYLAQLLRDALPRPPVQPSRPPEEEAKDEVERFRAALSSVWKKARAEKRTELEARLQEIAKQASGFTQRLKSEPVLVLRDARKLGVEVEKIQAQLEQPGGKGPGDSSGLLEGSS